MHTEVKYTGTPEEKTAKALKDTKTYLGGKLYNALAEYIGSDDASLAKVLGIFMVAGVSGFPVDAMIRTHGKGKPIVQEWEKTAES